MRTSVLIFSFMCIIGIFQTHAQIVFEITLQNNRHTLLDLTFKQGELFEVQGDDMQHIALFTDTSVILRGRETAVIRLRGYCTNQHRNSPSSGQAVLVTCTVINAPEYVFDSQAVFWEYLRNQRR
jgi:hypothetical protein